MDVQLPLLDGQPDLTQGTIVFIGTATVLIRYAGFTILTDPNFLHKGESVHLGYGLRSERLTDPAMNLEDLPAFDLVVLSHLHEDHFDRVVQQRRLNRTVPIITTPQSAQALARMGFQKTIPYTPGRRSRFLKAAFGFGSPACRDVMVLGSSRNFCLP